VSRMQSRDLFTVVNFRVDTRSQKIVDICLEMIDTIDSTDE